MNILKLAQSAVLQYGKSGDNSFECLGINFENGVVSETKVYRYYRSRNDKIIDWSDDIDLKIKNCIDAYEKNGLIKLSEISRKTVNGVHQYRLNFSVKSNIPFEDHYRETNGFFNQIGFSIENSCIGEIEKAVSDYLSPNRSPLIVFGIGIDTSSNVSEIKAYFSLERFSHYSQRIGEKLFFEELDDVIKEISNLPPIHKCKMDCLTDIGHLCSKNRYYPFLIGINQSENEFEHKLYFRIKTNSLTNEEIYLSTVNLIKNIGRYFDLNDFEQVLYNFYEMGLFLEGFAIGNTIANGRRIKLYFYPLPAIKI